MTTSGPLPLFTWQGRWSGSVKRCIVLQDHLLKGHRDAGGCVQLTERLLYSANHYSVFANG